MCRFQHNLYLIIFYDNCQLWVRNQLLKTVQIAISFQKQCQERLHGFWVEREIIFGQSEEKCWASLGYNILILFAAWVPQRPHGVTTQKINDSRFGIVLVHLMHLSFVNKGPNYFAIYLNPKFGCSSVNNSYMGGWNWIVKACVYAQVTYRSVYQRVICDRKATFEHYVSKYNKYRMYFPECYWIIYFREEADKERNITMFPN